MPAGRPAKGSRTAAASKARRKSVAASVADSQAAQRVASSPPAISPLPPSPLAASPLAAKRKQTHRPNSCLPSVKTARIAQSTIATTALAVAALASAAVSTPTMSTAALSAAAITMHRGAARPDGSVIGCAMHAGVQCLKPVTNRVIACVSNCHKLSKLLQNFASGASRWAPTRGLPTCRF